MLGRHAGVSRREFLAGPGRPRGRYSLAAALPFPAAALGRLLDNPRIAQTPLVDAGFASVRKIGDGLYATISDTSKGISTMCNGGVLVGKEGGRLVGGFFSGAGTGVHFAAR